MEHYYILLDLLWDDGRSDKGEEINEDVKQWGMTLTWIPWFTTMRGDVGEWVLDCDANRAKLNV